MASAAAVAHAVLSIEMQIDVLGPIRITAADGSPVVLGPAKQRLVFALLVSRVGRPVPVPELVDEVWGADPPPSARSNLRSYVHGLREALGADAIAGTGRPGYMLTLDSAFLDVTSFAELGSQGEAALAAGDLAAARSLLAAALRLWRGAPYCDVADVPALAREATALGELRLTLLERRIEADLAEGRAAELVAELTTLVAQHPFRERFVGQLMTALYRCERQCEALEVYRRLRRTLRAELAVEPDERLRTLERAILRRDPALRQSRVGPADAGAASAGGGPAPVPAQLPAAPTAFTGREPELAILDELSAGDGGRGRLVVVTGGAGTGKTALAVHWGYRRLGRFPDGQLFIDLRGFDPGPPVGPQAAVGRLLRSLGVPPERVPPTLDEACGLYRSLMFGRRALLVVDNAATADQIRPLLPGGGGCAVVVTSRNRLPGLGAVDGARQLELHPLPTDDAVRLVERLLGPVDGDEAAVVAELASLCGHLPLALRIAAANLAGQPAAGVARYVAELRGVDRLRALDVDGDSLGVRAAFNLSYAALDRPQRRLFRLLGLVPGPDVDVGAAAVLAGASLDRVRRDLVRLADAHLVAPTAEGRYTLHDLLREYARALALAIPAAGRRAAVARLYDHYAVVARDAARVLFPQAVRLPGPAGAPESGEGAEAHALAVLATEWPNLVAACVRAADDGPRPAAWRIADAVRTYCWSRHNVTDWLVVAQAARRAALAEGDLAAQASAELSLAQRHVVVQECDAALDGHRRAAELARRAGWREGEAAALGNVAGAYFELSDLPQAVECSRVALEISRDIGWPAGRAVALANLGLWSMMLGRLADAVDTCRAALDAYDEIGSVGGRAVVLGNLAEAHLLAGRVAEATVTAEQARVIAERLGRADTAAQALSQLSAARREAGEATAAVRYAEATLRLAEPSNPGVGALAHHVMALALDRLGEHRRALVHHRTAVELAGGVGPRYQAVTALVGLAGCQTHLGMPEAAASARTALELARAKGYRIVAGQALAVLAGADPDHAMEHALQALAVQDSTGWRLGRARLVALAQTVPAA